MQSLDETSAPHDPLVLFSDWLREATEAGMPEPNAMTLATVGSDGRPSARMVLLKGHDERGFTFFTNYASHKAEELAVNPYAALVFFWAQLHRQIRIEGTVSKTAPEESEAYFATRPRGSQIAAHASAQSRIVADRDELIRKVNEVELRFAGNAVSRPSVWGGYRVSARVIEFWQGRRDRLHDRLLYTRERDQNWLLERLFP